MVGQPAISSLGKLTRDFTLQQKNKLSKIPGELY